MRRPRTGYAVYALMVVAAAAALAPTAWEYERSRNALTDDDVFTATVDDVIDPNQGSLDGTVAQADDRTVPTGLTAVLLIGALLGAATVVRTAVEDPRNGPWRLSPAMVSMLVPLVALTVAVLGMTLDSETLNPTWWHATIVLTITAALFGLLWRPQLRIGGRTISRRGFRTRTVDLTDGTVHVNRHSQRGVVTFTDADESDRLSVGLGNWNIGQWALAENVRALVDRTDADVSDEAADRLAVPLPTADPTVTETRPRHNLSIDHHRQTMDAGLTTPPGDMTTADLLRMAAPRAETGLLGAVIALWPTHALMLVDTTVRTVAGLVPTTTAVPPSARPSWQS